MAVDSNADGSAITRRIAHLAIETGRTVAVAESLTGGLVASELAAAERASVWFRGGVVAYASDVKHDLLGVPDGPVVSETAARVMAESVRAMFAADLAIAVTGVGGPDPQDGLPPGTVWFATASAGGTRAFCASLEAADPTAVCYHARERAVELIEESMRAL